MQTRKRIWSNKDRKLLSGSIWKRNRTTGSIRVSNFTKAEKRGIITGRKVFFAFFEKFRKKDT